MIISRLYAIVDAETLARKNISVRVFARELREAGVRLVQYRDKMGGPQEVLRGAAEVAEAFAGVDAVLVMNDRADLAALMGWGVHVGQGDLPVEAAKQVLSGIAATGEIRGSLHCGAKSAPSVEMTEFLVGVSTHDAEQVRAADAALASCEPTSQKRDVGHPALSLCEPTSQNRDMGHPAPSVEMTELLVGVSTHDAEQVRAADAALASCEPTSQKRDVGHPALSLCEPTSQNRDMGHPVLLAADYVAVGPVFGTTTKLDAEAVVGLEGVRRARALTTKPLVAIGGITLENCASVIEAGADSVAVISGIFVEGRGVGEVVRDFLARLR